MIPPSGHSSPSRVAHLVVVGNLKGGTGKSTVSVNLAAALGSAGARVALVDLDEQGSSAAWTARGGLPMQCLHLPLARIEDAGPWLDTLARLRAESDIVLMDFPAGVAPALAMALLMASLILIPTSPNEIEIAATRRMLQHVRRARAERPGSPPEVLVVPNRVIDMDRGLNGYHDRLAALGETLAPPLRFHAQHDQAFEAGQWIGAWRPRSPAHQEVMVLAELVCARLAASVPVAGPLLARQTRPGGSSAVHAPLPPGNDPKVIYLDEETAHRLRRSRDAPLLMRWAMRLVGSMAVAR